jgi:hypothetical protein
MVILHSPSGSSRLPHSSPHSLSGTSGETDPCIGFGTDLDPVPDPYLSRDLKTKSLRILIVEKIYFHVRNCNTFIPKPTVHEVR